MMQMRRKIHPAAAPDYAMCWDPGTATIVAAGAAVAGTGISAMSAMNQGKAMQKQAEYNAALQERQALMTKRAAELQEQKYRNQSEKLRSSQRAAVAASGLDLEGSPLLFMSETAAENELDALMIRHAGSVQEAQMNAQAAADRMAGRAARMQGYANAGASVLSGVGSLGRLYASYGPSTPSPTLSANNYGFTQNPGGIDDQ